ncbi:PHP domain-containing protein [Mammaliicoccus sciuri]|uniref:PHP domain-containing protein n=1 Tax=Mammaliicoccus sciuri TaxID=1296 RepID=UPI001C6373BC|nr:PHP domain-containing protein [Mammaliicoccus sciuri]QYG30072.1 PHP domain-containing protein [Mammaliicoccus sciuri]
MINYHGHTDMSNIRLLDSINSTEDLIYESVRLGHSGTAITDHEALGNHVKAIQIVKEGKKKGKIPESYSLVLGNELYLVDSREEVRDNYQGGGKTKFPHFLVLAKNRKGHEAMRRLSSIAWENSFMAGGQRRVPTEKQDLERMVKEYPNSLVMTTACLGSESSIHILNDEYDKAESFIEWCVSLVGKDDFYLEIQPNVSDEQTKVNKKLIEYSHKYGLELIVTCDAHYLRPELFDIHSAYLNAKGGDRETSLFYADTYLHTEDEIREKLSYIDRDILDRAIMNTLKMRDKFEQYDLHNDTDIPRIIPDTFELNHTFKPAYDQFENIKNAAYSDEEQDRYLLYLIEEGFLSKEPIQTITKEYFYKAMDRINKELGEILGISEILNQTMSSYYITMKKIIDIIWSSDECGGDSLVGGRGSVGAFYMAYLLSITEFNPLTCGLEIPHWRHLSATRPEIGDIDLDSCATRRSSILSALKNYFGEDKVLSVCTYGTETARSAIKTASRGLNYNSDDATYLGSLLETTRGATRTLKDSLTGDDGEPINTQLKNEMEKYPKLIETALGLEGLINKSSSHAGGICIYNEPYWKTNALMLTPRGTKVTQLNLKDSEYVGNIKYDILTTEAMDKMRETLDLLLDANEIEWKGSLKETFNYYFHPDNLEYEDPKLYELLASGKLPDMFQFTSELGSNILSKVQPKTLVEISAASNLMRLQAPAGEEQPVDTFARYRKDISLWYDEMREHGLNEEEIKIMEEHLLALNGVCDSQESLMLLVMDKRISDFDVVWANKLRKAIAKKDPKTLDETKQHYIKHCKEIGTSDALRDYIWDVQIYRQLGYSFPSAHSMQYSTVMFQELNMGYKFNSVYWQTACLNMNSGSVETEDSNGNSGSIDYGKVSTAVSKLKNIGVNVSLPDINKSKYSFVPDAKNNTIIYGLKPIKDINEEIAHQIIDNRPYNDFEEFMSKLYDTKIITNKHLISLIKSGALDSFGGRKQVMMEAIKYITPTKDNLTLSSVGKILESGIINDRPELPLILLRESFKNKVLRKVTTGKAKTPHKVFKVEDMETYDTVIGNEGITNVMNGYYEVDEKEFKKVFDKKTSELKKWLKSDESLDLLNRYELNQTWLKYNLNTSLSKWEMDTLNYYYHDHELIDVNDSRYEISRFSSLPKEPVIKSYNKWRGRDIPVYETANVIGTVLGIDKGRHTVTLLDIDGNVFSVKYHAGSFANYNKVISKTDSKGKKTTIEKSWFSRGNHLLVHGFRRGGQFVAKKYKDSKTSTTTKLIESVHEDGLLSYKLEREYI